MDESESRSADEFLIAVLSDAADDLSGIYEVWWQANAWFPSWPLSQRLRLAEDTVRALADDGLVSICRGGWETASADVVPADETEAVLRDWETWVIPDGPRVFFFATNDGKAQLQRVRH